MLRRYPDLPNDPLQAWDSADTLLLEHLATRDLASRRVLVVNDSFGALTCGIKAGALESYSDSYLTRRAIERNSGGAHTTLAELDALTGSYELIALRVPKSMSFLEDILCHLTQHTEPGTPLVATAMVKHLAPAAFDLIERYFGTTTTSLAQKKARLIFAAREREPVVSPHPKEVLIEGFSLPFCHHANLFSREKLDIGTRFFLEHVPTGDFGTILDLGCGNGIVGIRALQQNPLAAGIFSDISWQALQSARTNAARFLGEREVAFRWTHAYEDGEPGSVDLVLCNPPFHQDHTIGDAIAWQMFSDARRALRPGGLLRVIGNAHLGYHLKLKRLFGRSRIVATNDKFLIVDARKRD